MTSKNRLPGLGSQLVAARTHATVSQAALARRSTLTRPTVAQAESGSGKLCSFESLARTLGYRLIGVGLCPGHPLGEGLASVRAARQLSRRAVAAIADVSIPTIAAIESGAKGAHLAAVERLANAMGIMLALRPLNAPSGYWSTAAISSSNDTWQTPPELLDRLYGVIGGGFDLDPCSPSHDPGVAPVRASAYLTVNDDGLSHPWRGLVFMNPPYGRSVTGDWVAKARRETEEGRAQTVFGLVPARPGTGWWHKSVAGPADIFFLRGRLRFVGAASAAPFPSALALWGAGELLLAGMRQAFPDAHHVPRIRWDVADAAD